MATGIRAIAAAAAARQCNTVSVCPASNNKNKRRHSGTMLGFISGDLLLNGETEHRTVITHELQSYWIFLTKVCAPNILHILVFSLSILSNPIP